MPNGSDIAAGTAALAPALNAISVANQNKKARNWSEKMYNLQKEDALKFWGIQNAYNSPQAQMKRFQEAGLNPHLIYGQGNTSSPVSTPDMRQPEFRVPEWGNAATAALSAYYDTQIKQATANNLEKQGTVLEQERLLKEAQTLATRVDAERREFDLGQEYGLAGVSADYRREQLRATKIGTDIAERRDVREAISNVSNLNEANNRILNMVEQRANMLAQRAHTDADRQRIYSETARIKQSIALMAKEGKIKDLDVKLAARDIRPGDPLWYRAIQNAYNSVLEYLGY